MKLIIALLLLLPVVCFAQSPVKDSTSLTPGESLAGTPGVSLLCEEIGGKPYQQCGTPYIDVKSIEASDNNGKISIPVVSNHGHCCIEKMKLRYR